MEARATEGTPPDPGVPPVLPKDVVQAQECILEALATETPLELIGAGSKRSWGRAVSAQRTLSMSALAGVVDYEPGELLLVLRPGTPLAQVEALLAEQGQQLAFEPPHWGESATIGGTIGTNASGPRRLRAGAARDYILGVQAINGRGEVIRSGGRVMKNVTGYDLSKLLCGSFGTLAAITELCLKVLPAAEAERTLLWRGLGREGFALLRRASACVEEVSAAAQLSAAASPPLGLEAGVSWSALRLEGTAASLDARADSLILSLRAEMLAVSATALSLEGEQAARFWRAVRELEPLPLRPTERLWRFSIPPAAAEALVASLAQTLETLGEAAPLRSLHDWGGALLWAALPARCSGTSLHALALRHGGHAQRFRDGAAVRVEAEPCTPLSAPLERLHAQLKDAFDPRGVLNPRRMYAHF